VTWTSSGDSLARDVLLQGEAYFDVVHDEHRPFRVRARNVVVRDLGTRFAVRAYLTDTLVRVAVTHGQVRVGAATAPQASGATLDPGMLGLVNAGGVTSVRRDADTARYNAFARGQMQFVRTPLSSVIDELERWYDIDIQLSDSALGNRRITATLDDQTLPDLLVQLSITLNLRVTHTGRLVVFHAQ
jgi:ferric-dicitrate binding protein FerR (iron transport regulator)